MQLDDISRRYADSLFAQECDKIARDEAMRPKRERVQSGAFLAELARTGLLQMEALAHARADTLVAAYERGRVPIDEQTVEEILADVSQLCDTKGGSLSQSIRDAARRTGTEGQLDTALAGEIASEASRMVAQVRRKLNTKRDEALLDARIAPKHDEQGQLDDLLPILARRQFDDDLAPMVSSASASAPISLIMTDVDRFKDINDKLLHSGGDKVLIGVASVLNSACKGKGRRYRWGGDEMAVLLPNYTSSEALTLAERAREMVSQLEFEGYADRITLSVGIASFPGTCSTSAQLFTDADRALYEAKNGGRNQVRLAGGSVGAVVPKADARLSQAEISQRLEKVRLWVKLLNGRAENFLFMVENKSDEEVVIEEVRLESDGYPITEPAFPPNPGIWNVRPKGSQPVAWACQSDPATSLTRMNDNKGLFFKADLRVVLKCSILGQSREFDQRIPVQVKVTNREIVSLL